MSDSERAFTRRATVIPMSSKVGDAEPAPNSMAELLERIRTMKMEPSDRAYLVRAVNRIHERTLELAVRAMDFSIDRNPHLARFRALLEELHQMLERSKPEERFRREMDLLEDAAQRDPLTGLFRKPKLTEYVERLIAEEINLRWCSLGILDLRRFKQVNDQCGHSVGDEVIRAVGKILRGKMRDQGWMLARLGGDEFGFVIPQPATFSLRIGERLRREIEDFAWTTIDPRLNADFGLKADIGIASLRLGPRERRFYPQTAASELYHQADKLMYEAKLKGLMMTQLAVFRIRENGKLLKIPGDPGTPTGSL